MPSCSRIYGILIVLATPLFSSAQLCQGSLGDPIVNITFGSGLNPGPLLNAATTTYQYVFSDCPEDGFYAVRNNTSSCFNDTWHGVYSDHTGDANGYFMLVNASFEPGAFYLETVHDLCPNTTYEFAAWIMNVLREFACSFQGIKPNLTFTIESTNGAVLQTYETGDISTTPVPSWKQYGFFFTTPPGLTDVRIRIVNNSKGGCGNDIALDDITFRPCGPLVTAAISGYPGTSVSFCEGPAKSFTMVGTVSAGFSNPSLQWQSRVHGGSWVDIPGANSDTYSRSFPANELPQVFEFRLSVAEEGNLNSAKCRVASLPVSIEVAAIPVTTITTNSPACVGRSLNFSAGGTAHYDWTGVNNYSATGNPVSIMPAGIENAGTYHMLATSIAGCTYEDSVTVEVNPSPTASVNLEESVLCEGQGIQFQSAGGISYQWIPATGLNSAVIANPWATPADTTLYNVVVYNAFSCTDTASILINVIERPRANAGPDRTIIQGNSTQLSGSMSGQAVSFNWIPSNFLSNMNTLQPLTSPPADIDYILNVSSGLGCGTDSDTAHIYVYKDVYVPTAFTPNGDGLNDTWYIPPLDGVAEFTISVFNRYGRLIFQAINVNTPWDGKYSGEAQPVGVYVYMIELKREHRLLKGTVTLIR